MLTATAAELAARRAAIARTPVLARLRDRLRTQVQPVLDRPLYLPVDKALLSQDGGICADDGSRLRFDPFSPDRHQCPRCGRWYEGTRHHRAWVTRYQIWLSERAIHLALLGGLMEDDRLSRRATEILAAYADRYRDYPNRDNVLGPTRLFFSTYLESIWLCQVVAAASLLDARGGSWDDATRDRVRAMVQESASLIASFDEGWSNRQAWNNAAMMGAGYWLGSTALVEAGREGAHGVRAALAHSVSADGLWFEGENYHFFALRGLLFAAEFERSCGADLYAEPGTGGALAALFASPLKTVLPDLTLPARSDAPFGVSLRQTRFADLWEVGRARVPEPSLDAILAALYAPGALDGEDYGLSELAEQEQNRPPQRLARDRLGWKALLWMPEADPGEPGEWQPGSTLLADHGLAVLRQGRRYISVECGGRPGGHGHPDLLHLTMHWGAHWLADPGTGSYVSPSLHWYRSTLAHNAPALTGADQTSRDAWCSAFVEQSGWGWLRFGARDLFGPGTEATRSIIAGPEWVLDIVDIHAPAGASVDLPLHPMGTLILPANVSRVAGDTAGVMPTVRLAGEVSPIAARRDGAEFFLALPPRAGETLHVALGLGPPDLTLADGAPLEFLIRRANGSGRWIQAYSMEPVTLQVDRSRITIERPGTVDVVEWSGQRVSITSAGGEATTLESAMIPRSRHQSAVPARLELRGGRGIRLGAEHYRRAEDPYDPAFRAEVDISGSGTRLSFDIRVHKAGMVVRRPVDPDPRLDNESPDIHSDGIQLYADIHGWQGYLLIPDLESDQVYIRALTPAAGQHAVAASWQRIPGGYRVNAGLEVGRTVRRGDRFAVNVVVNQMTPGRERRAGQLALSGGGWVYLRGDREPSAGAVVVEIP